MKKIILAFLIIGFNKSYSQQKNFQLSYNIEQKSEKHGEGEFLDSNSIPDPLVNDLFLQLLNNGSFITLKKEDFTFFDLKNEMVFNYTSDILSSAVPLYYIIDYRIAEYNNRVFLTNMLQAGGAGNVFGDFANLETVFGIEDNKNNIRDSIEEKNINNTHIYSINNIELVKIIYSKNKLPNEYLEAFSKYLTYKTEIHPSIKEEIIKTKLVPDYFQYNYIDVGIKTTITYSLKGVQELKNAKIDISNKKQVSYEGNDSNMDNLIDSMMNYTTLNKVSPFDSTIYFSEANKLSNNGENLSGLLRLLEYLLSTGNQPTKQIREITPKQNTDTLLAKFLYCLNSPQSKEEAELKISELEDLIKLNLKYGYLMNIFAANYIEPIDQYEATSYFYKALSHNQYITGAWLDLGKIYANRYMYDTAWKCFGILLNIKPDHPMAQEIKEKKRTLKEKYTDDYFKLN